MTKPILPPKSSREATARRIKITREALRLRPVDISRATGITRPQYANYEAGLSRPNIEDAIRFSETFGISLDWIYKGDASKLPLDVADRIRKIVSETGAKNVI